ncbi:MAG TPA: TerB family tellurite resistance protein [Zeimonas sp.]|nr:TerB family tellurite resistance protein [Zeimonas sp.]
MISALRTFLERHLGTASDAARQEHGIELATAALFAEMMRIDGETTAEERDAARDAIVDRLGLSPAEAAELLEAAHEEVRAASDYFQFTSLLNRHFTQEQKIAVIERMWRVAYSDARLDDHELHLIRRIADLLHVPHPDFIAAKIRAREREGRRGKGEGEEGDLG